MAVFSVQTRHGERAYACPRPRGGLLNLTYSDRLGPEFLFRPPALDIAGTNVGWADESKDGGSDFSGGGLQTLIHRAVWYPPDRGPRYRGWHGGEAVDAGPQQDSQVGSLVVDRKGAAAWIACPPKPHDAARGCRRPGHRDAVYISEALTTHRTLVARGRDIDPDSLTRSGSHIFWRQGGTRRSATLRSGSAR
jgi:hypothetical protein